MRYLFFAPLALLLLIAPGANASPVKVKPTYAITAASVSGKSVKFTLTSTLPSSVKSCPGKKTKLEASVNSGSKKIWDSARAYTLDSEVCVALFKGKLPAKKYGKTVKFSFSFPGTKKIKKFSGSKKLKLVPPAANTGGPGTPTQEIGPQAFGKWRAEDPLDSSHQFMFTIKSPDHAVPGITNWLGGNTVMDCGSSYEHQYVNFNWNQAFTLGGPIGKTTYSDNVGFAHGLLYTFNFSFTTAHEGSGSMTALGDYDVGGGVIKTCSVSFNFTLNWAGPEF
ncbi:MAG: hypothetical protein QM648_10495 [Solirubrobacterales bacterium]